MQFYYFSLTRCLINDNEHEQRRHAQCRHVCKHVAFLYLCLILWPPDAKRWLTGKDPDAGKDWGQEEKGITEDEMVGRHRQLDGHGFGWTLGVGDGQGGLACCNSWSHKEWGMTEWLNWTELASSVQDAPWKQFLQTTRSGNSLILKTSSR